MEQIIDWVSIASAAIAIMVLVAIAKMNKAIKLLNNRMNLISQAQKTLAKELAQTSGTKVDDALASMDEDLRKRLERDFG